MNVEYATNMKTVDEIVEYIRDRLNNVNKNWRDIAEAFSEAKMMFGIESGRFKSLCKATRFSLSKVTKLIKITESKRLKTYETKLSSVHSWGALYAISTLSESKFEELKKIYNLDVADNVSPFITQQAVEKIRKGPSEKNFLKSYAVIKIDGDALKGGLLDGSDLEEMHKLMEKMANISRYIKVDKTKVDEKNNIFWLNLVEDRVNQLARKQFTNAIAGRIAIRKKSSGEKQDKFEISCLGMTREELMDMYRENRCEAFKYLGVELSLPDLYRKAEIDINSRMDKYANKAMDRPKRETLPPRLEANSSLEEVEFPTKKDNLEAQKNKLAFASFKWLRH